MVKWGLGVGMSHTLEDVGRYGGAGAARRFKSCLVRRFGFQAKNVTLLLDDKKTKVCNARNILRKFKRMRKRSKPGDTLILFFMGHGGVVNSLTDPLTDDNISDISRYYMVCSEGTSIDGAQLLHIMNKVKHDRSFYAVMDFCKSGGIFQGLAKEQLKPYTENPKPNKSLSSQSNAIMITATRRTGFSWTKSFRKKGGKVRGVQYDLSLPRYKQKLFMKTISRYRYGNSTKFVEAFRKVAKKYDGDRNTKEFVEGIDEITATGDIQDMRPQLYCSDIQANLKFLG